ncbi:chromatin assembly factor 1 subunit A-domain-containing protein [Pyrenochaeta sp. MPI-SDFR-AT-0127]|nr:chromatin assembly factor 1 subunit A-domain-containing protein [Pyrenochaeta sp. MPI-SDFR-AT-0127]
MEDPIAPISQKRLHEEDDEPAVTTPVKAIRSEASTPLSVISHIQTPSPLKRTAPSIPLPASSSTPQPAKRRKLTEKEKDDQRLEKEAKAKARAEKKAQKDAEDKLKAEQRAQKEEERRSKDEEKRKKIEERDEKKRQKEEEQQQKEEEKAKKERAQMKLNAFFVKPKTTGVTAGQATVDSTQNPTTPSVSLLPEPAGVITDSIPPSPQKTLIKNAQSDYERYFFPFNLAAHVVLAPKNAFLEDPIKLKAAQTRLENVITQEDVSMDATTLESFKSSFRTRGRGLRTASIIDVIECVNGSSDRPIDLTNDRDSASSQPLDMLNKIPMKYLHFGEDVRPPYYGTYTRSYTDAETAQLARNPFTKVRQDTNYDYDSEAEWDEPEEGEDLDSDGEDDIDEEAEDEMDGFLDDEEDPQVKRRLISGDLVPVSTGLCWEDAHRVSKLNDGSGAICTDFKDFKMGFLFEPTLDSIDPFSTAYWTPDPAPTTLTAMPPSKDASTNNLMNPPRAPLAQRTMNGLLNTLNTPQHPLPRSASKSAKAKRMIPTEQLPAFKAEIDGKDLTKIGMIEALKKVFPKLPKDAITNTLSVVAARVGPTEKEKRWVLINN